MTVEAIEEEAWDRQIEQDFAPGGRGDHLLAEAQADFAEGRTRLLKDFLAEAGASLQAMISQSPYRRWRET